MENINFSDYYDLYEGKITAKVLADSMNYWGDRLTTVEIRFPRIIISHLLTHRNFSRNTSSNRAKPIKSVIKDVRENGYVPELWLNAHKGMQSNAIAESYEALADTEKWLFRLYDTCDYVTEHFTGKSKQLANRLLEPFQYVDMVVTATEWDNFFNLRIHEAAQFEIQVLANRIKQAMDNSIPVKLHKDEWHLPYVTEQDTKLSLYEQKLISVARCARVSYKTFDSDKPSTPESDVRLCTQLFNSKHMSPFEHIATPLVTNNQKRHTRNFNGFVQLRGLVEDGKFTIN